MEEEIVSTKEARKKYQEKTIEITRRAEIIKNGVLEKEKALTEKEKVLDTKENMLGEKKEK